MADPCDGTGAWGVAVARSVSHGARVVATMAPLGADRPRLSACRRVDSASMQQSHPWLGSTGSGEKW